MSRYAIGIDLGGTSIKAALVAEGQGIVRKERRATEAMEGPQHVLDRLAELVDAMQPAADGPVLGVGIGAPGAVNWARTSIAHSPNIDDWDMVDVQEELRARCGGGLHVVVENDANVAALGSAFYGTGQPFDSFIMITLGTGVGGAIIYNDQIFRGATGGAGEIGHMTIDYEGPIDRAGVAGAIEAYVGQHFLSRYARFRLLNEPDSLIHVRANDELTDITPRMLYEAAIDGDAHARAVFDWAGHKLGCALGAAVNLLDIRKIVVGGGVSAAGALILEPARRAIVRYVMPGLRDGIEILREEHGNEVGMLGAAHLLFEPATTVGYSS